ncbi:HPP family protein [Denitratisoma sp. agr-D3]
MIAPAHALARFARSYLIADAAPLSARERWRSALAGLFGLLLMQALLTVVPVDAETRRLLAPAGASAVILFCLPHSPLGQPWSVAGGLLLSAAAGIACGRWLHPSWLAIPCAVAIAIWAMAALRCLHPPGGALAIVMASQHAGWEAMGAVAFNVLGLLLAAMMLNNIVGRRQYPQCAAPQPARPVFRREAESAPPTVIDHQDLAVALARVDSYLDITESDLVTVFGHAAENAFRRRHHQTCGDLMEREVVCVEFATELDTLWRLFQGEAGAALPVLDRAGRMIGLVTLEGLMRHVPVGEAPLAERLRRFLLPTPGPNSAKAEVAGQIMTERFTTVREDDDLSQAASLLLAGTGQADLPVVDGRGKFVGLLRPRDILAALYHRQALEEVRLA